jgi:hypothetical protein
MNSFFEKISLSLLLRWGIAGALTVLTFVVSGGYWDYLMRWLNSDSGLGSFLSLCLIAGSFTYGVYRSWLYPCLFRILNRCAEDCRESRFRRYVKEFRNMIVLWDTNAPDSGCGLHNNRHQRITSWADIAHSQMIGGISVIASGLSAKTLTYIKCIPELANLQEPASCGLLGLMVLGGIAYFFVGFYSMYRLLAFQLFIDVVCPYTMALSISDVEGWLKSKNCIDTTQPASQNTAST